MVSVYELLSEIARLPTESHLSHRVSNMLLLCDARNWRMLEVSCVGAAVM